MAAAAASGATAIMAQTQTLLGTMGALYAIPIGIAAFAAVVGILVHMIRG